MYLGSTLEDSGVNLPDGEYYPRSLKQTCHHPLAIAESAGYAANAIGGAPQIVRGHESHLLRFYSETPAVMASVT